MATINEGIKTFDCHGGTDIPAFSLCAYITGGYVKAFDVATDTLLQGVSMGASVDDKVVVKCANFPGSVRILLDLNESITDADIITFGATAGTVKKAGAADPPIGYTRTTATSTASVHAVLECVLFSGAQLLQASDDINT